MNEEEIILRNYLFHFLRPENYKTDVNYYLPKFLTKDPAFAETQRTLSWEHEQYRLKIIDFAKQFHPQTATWGLNVWEEELGLPTDLSIDLELRRAKVMAKLLGASPMTVANTNKLVNLFTNDGSAYVDELPEPGIVKIILPSKTVHLDELRSSLDEMLPAHLAYYFQHIIEIDDDEEDGKPDDVSDINDESTADTGERAFFIHADFPISENVPYGNLSDTPKYDGNINASTANMFNGNVQFDNAKNYDGINSDIAKIGASRKWWFVPTGNSFFNKEFMHNGAIRYDKLKPQEIEYDCGMDELSPVEVEKYLEDDVSEQYNYNGIEHFDGVATAHKGALPADNGGNLAITRINGFDGRLPYNGGDINFFNGTIKANGKFSFEGGGSKANCGTVTDSLDGKFDNTRATKADIPLSDLNPELYDFIPLTLEKQRIEISTGVLEDTIKHIVDEGNSVTVSKAIRYNGKLPYNGGDINFFNGAIKADGNFNFEGDGNRADIQIIATDTDGTIKLKRPSKDIPPLYLELFDLTNVYDKTKLSAHIELSDNSVLSDGNGEMIVRRRSRYNGKIYYHGYFEYSADAKKHFNGNLKYDNNYRVSADYTDRFNGIERYGGRKDFRFIEYVSDLNGNVIMPDINSFEKIPIATRTRLGFVIVGNNIDIDDNGKISLPERFTIPPITEMKSGKLRTLLGRRRI